MTGEKKENDFSNEQEKIRIDYDNIDVADIMDQIKRKIAAQPKKPTQAEFPKEELRYAPHLQSYTEPEEPAGVKKKMKKLLLKIMKPFSPLIKILVLPVHEEAMEAMRNLHETNKRLDGTNKRLDETNKRLDDTNKRLDLLIITIEKERKKLDHINQTINRRLNFINEKINRRLNYAFDELGKTMEYTKLLHSLSHNIVVELSKMKIEEENLKLKTRIMEKDFEFLGRKEKVIEREVFK